MFPQTKAVTITSRKLFVLFCFFLQIQCSVLFNSDGMIPHMCVCVWGGAEVWMSFEGYLLSYACSAAFSDNISNRNSLCSLYQIICRCDRILWSLGLCSDTNWEETEEPTANWVDTKKPSAGAELHAAQIQPFSIGIASFIQMDSSWALTNCSLCWMDQSSMRLEPMVLLA